MAASAQPLVPAPAATAAPAPISAPAASAAPEPAPAAPPPNTAPVSAPQGIRVEQSGGVSAGGAPATLSFDTTTGEQVVVRRILDQASAQMTSNFGYSASATAEDTEDLCLTPCKLTLASGYYKIRFGEYNPMNANTPIDLNIGPGESRYRIEPFEQGKFIGGALAAILGGTAVIVGASLAAVDLEGGRTGYIALAAAGAGVTIGGILMISAARVSVEQEF